MVRRAGIEPATNSLEGYCSIPLSYRRKKMADKVGFEPTTGELTALCSTVELLVNKSVKIFIIFVPVYIFVLVIQAFFESNREIFFIF